MSKVAGEFESVYVAVLLRCLKLRKEEALNGMKALQLDDKPDLSKLMTAIDGDINETLVRSLLKQAQSKESKIYYDACKSFSQLADTVGWPTQWAGTSRKPSCAATVTLPSSRL